MFCQVFIKMHGNLGLEYFYVLVNKFVFPNFGILPVNV